MGSGDPSSGAADVTFILKDSDFLAMFQGKLKPTNAFMTGKLKLKVGCKSCKRYIDRANNIYLSKGILCMFI